MKKLILAAIALILATVAAIAAKPRIIVSTDIGGTDADDNQSMLHLLMFSDLFDIEGLISTPSFGNGSKQEILRMIDIYAADYPTLKDSFPELTPPDALRALCKQGTDTLAPVQGYSTHTEGSDWIIECARRESDRPLWILVWGTLEDVAQALHDAPDILDKIRVVYIGGPNKKFGVNSYAYLAAQFPSLWMIENNASYRGFTANAKDPSPYHAGFYEASMAGAGHIGADFINYYNGIPKMGDTPSLLYLFPGSDPDDPTGDSAGGSFTPTNRAARRILNPTLDVNAKVPVYSVVEFEFKAAELDLDPGTPCFTLKIDKQEWPGYYMGNGTYFVRYSPKQAAILPYRIYSESDIFPEKKGILKVSNDYPGDLRPTDYKLGDRWWTDRPDPSLMHNKWHGYNTVSPHRPAILDLWTRRLSTLKPKEAR